MEWLIQLAAGVLALSIVLTRSYRPESDGLSEFELKRRVDSGDDHAAYELHRRSLLPAMAGQANLKTLLLTAILALLLFASFGTWLGFGFLILYLLLVEVVVAKGWLHRESQRLGTKLEPIAMPLVAAASPATRHLSPMNQGLSEFELASRQDLERLIANDENVLSPTQKAKLLGALSLGDLTVADVMVSRDKMSVVGASETVGPLLLDKLHKAGHHVFPVAKKDLDKIQGLLYLHDIVKPHPDLKTVKDALRPTVHYIGAKQPLSAVLVASLQSGRQLFIVVDDNGNTQGLITLRDALEKLMGTAPPDETYSSTDPKQVKAS